MNLFEMEGLGSISYANYEKQKSNEGIDENSASVIIF